MRAYSTFRSSLICSIHSLLQFSNRNNHLPSGPSSVERSERVLDSLVGEGEDSLDGDLERSFLEHGEDRSEVRERRSEVDAVVSEGGGEEEVSLGDQRKREEGRTNRGRSPSHPRKVLRGWVG